jgi:serine/threonine-protein phosphatase CPPED1
MTFIRRPAQRFPALGAGLVILLLLAWAGAGFAAEAGPLPAQDWNLKQLENLKAPAADPLTFAVVGDTRSNPAIFTQVLKQMEADAGITFAMDLGDVVESGTLEQFEDFFKLVRAHISRPFLIAPGNHDLGRGQDVTLFRRIFGPDYFAFPVKDHYFIVVNDNLKTGLGEAQSRWLEDELKKAQSFKTRIVFLHYPLFDPRGGKFRHALPVEAGTRMAALFLRYRVTHIFASHIHGYFTGNWEGVPFTVSGGGGAKLAGDDPAHFFYHYIKVSLSGGHVQVQVQRLGAEGTH